MRTMLLQWDRDAWSDYLYWQSEDKRILRKVNQLLQDILRNPFEGIGKPEALKGSLTGMWSRRIDGANRVVYSVNGNIIYILACRGHYKR